MNPVALAHKVEETYRRYLRTTFYFKDPALRASFEDALRPGCLSKGPYLEATPMFKRGATPHRFFGSLLGFEPEPGFPKALQGERPLYLHQEEAIRRVVDNHNVVVATGTGSGKTECFLYPILLHLYREFQAGALCPGVRALVLYPMNALANDQRDRLGEICRELVCGDSTFRFTFGQYIGETPENENDSQRHARDHIAKRMAGELVLRSEMRSKPPHILLTNYSMLEYLLLRPSDSPLFDDGSARWWTFLVLDEAHQYRGAKGIEMAMLIRRLKQRLREGGCENSFRCLATSATLMGGKEDKSAVAKFASDLFGEEFKEQDVILGEAEAIPESGAAELGRDEYELLAHVLNGDSIKQLKDIASRLGPTVSEDDDRAKTVGRLLQQDRRTNRLRHLVTGSPTEVQSIANYAFTDLPETDRVNALSELVAVLLRAKDPASGAPLLSARYHLFLRSLEGAFLTLWPNEQVLLDRRTAVDTALFEVGLCRECGQHYLVGKEANGKLMEAVRDPGQADFGATFFLPLKDAFEDEEDIDNDAKENYKLCARCGEIRKAAEQLRCGHNVTLLIQKQEEAREREDQIPRCAVCGYQAPDPVREVVHGTDGPHAVIATTLFQELPQTRKKVLAFADGRQDAAFFAWYLEKSYKDIFSRNLIFKAVQRQAAHTSEGSSIQDMAICLRELFRERGVFGAAISDLQVRREAWLASYREFLTDEPRISLEGVGLGTWYLKWPDWFQVPEILRNSPWSLSEQEIHDTILILLDSMRTGRAVELRGDNGVTLNWGDLGLQARQQRFRIGTPRRQIGVSSWDGNRTRRVLFMTKLLMRMESGLNKQKAVDYAEQAVRAVWEAIRECDGRASMICDQLLIPVEDARRLNPDWWRFRVLADPDQIFQCDTCSRVQAVCVRGLCPRHRCPGSLKEIRRQDLELNHYRLLYEAELPGLLRVEEHTAQLDKEKAREFQREFREGKIHVLSCSTTFELGVDLGDLDTIFLRNVPPEAFNYAQRVGRSGRRSGHPGFAITYCKRVPHDLYHFSEPQRMLIGKVQPPILAICNEKIIIRQVAAVALSSFFRSLPERFLNVESLFVDLDSPRGVADFKKFLLNNRPRIEDTIRRVVPMEIASQLGLFDGTWIEKIAGEDSCFALAEAEVSSDYKAVVVLKESAKSKDDFRIAEWAQRRSKTISKEEVLSFLSRKAVIPKYGFPVDAVELDTQRTQQNQEAFEVSLQRDLSIAISEFAPTSKLVANKKEWVSYGLKKVAEREWPRKFYSRCLTHNVFLQWNEGEPPPVSMPCGCQLRPWKYVIPKFGFVTDRDKPKEPKSRPAKVFSTRPYFAGHSGPEPADLTMPINAPLLAVKKASPGQMVVLCEGRRGEGFYLCSGCGAAFRSRPRSHKTPQGQNCQGVLEQVSLGQEFVTDVLQLQFHAMPPDETNIVWFTYSLAYAIVEGAAEVLEVPSTDLSATVAQSDWHALPPIILYDNVPGGAGLVARLEQEDMMNDCLRAALKRVDGACGCSPNTSCYGCLRGYRNQFAHQFLQRGPVHQYLISVCSAWRR